MGYACKLSDRSKSFDFNYSIQMTNDARLSEVADLKNNTVVMYPTGSGSGTAPNRTVITTIGGHPFKTFGGYIGSAQYYTFKIYGFTDIKSRIISLVPRTWRNIVSYVDFKINNPGTDYIECDSVGSGSPYEHCFLVKIL